MFLLYIEMSSVEMEEVERAMYMGQDGLEVMVVQAEGWAYRRL